MPKCHQGFLFEHNQTSIHFLDSR